MRVILFVIVFMIGIYRIPQPSLNSIEQPWVNRYVQFVKSQYMNYIWEPSIQPDLSEDQMLLRKDQFWQAEEKNRKLNNNNPNEDPIDWSIRRVVVYSRDQSCCRRCGARVPLDVHANDKYVAHIHHIIPRFKGGGGSCYK